MSMDIVYHLIHTRTPHQYHPKLIITDVPAGIDESALKEALERAGYQFGEFGIPWANHGITRTEDPTGADLAGDMVARIRAGEGERLTWEELQARAEAPLL